MPQKDEYSYILLMRSLRSLQGEGQDCVQSFSCCTFIFVLSYYSHHRPMTFSDPWIFFFLLCCPCPYLNEVQHDYIRMSLYRKKEDEEGAQEKAVRRSFHTIENKLTLDIQRRAVAL